MQIHTHVGLRFGTFVSLIQPFTTVLKCLVYSHVYERHGKDRMFQHPSHINGITFSVEPILPSAARDAPSTDLDSSNQRQREQVLLIVTALYHNGLTLFAAQTLACQPLACGARRRDHSLTHGECIAFTRQCNGRCADPKSLRGLAHRVDRRRRHWPHSQVVIAGQLLACNHVDDALALP